MTDAPSLFNTQIGDAKANRTSAELHRNPSFEHPQRPRVWTPTSCMMQ